MQHVNFIPFDGIAQTHSQLLRGYLLFTDTLPSASGQAATLEPVHQNESGATYLVASPLCHHAEIRLLDDGAELLLDCSSSIDPDAQAAVAASIEPYVVLTYLLSQPLPMQRYRVEALAAST